VVSYRRIRRQRHLTGSCDKVVPIMNQVGVIGPTNAALIERTSGLELGSLEAVARRIGFLLASKGTACAVPRFLLYSILNFGRPCSNRWQRGRGRPRPASGQVGCLRVITKRCFLKHPWAGIDMT